MFFLVCGEGADELAYDVANGLADRTRGNVAVHRLSTFEHGDVEYAGGRIDELYVVVMADTAANVLPELVKGGEVDAMVLSAPRYDYDADSLAGASFEWIVTNALFDVFTDSRARQTVEERVGDDGIANAMTCTDADVLADVFANYVARG